MTDLATSIGAPAAPEPTAPTQVPPATPATPGAEGVALPPLSARFAGVTSSIVRDLLALTRRPGVISFAGGLPAPELFDLDGAREAVESALSRSTLQYSTTEGDPELRGRVAALYDDAGLPTAPDDLLITTGSQQGLSLIASALVDPGDVVLVERPSYLAALQCLSLAGARLVGVPADADGPLPEAVDELARSHRPKAMYVVPTFHNPTGRTVDAARRAALVEIAARRGFRIIEDDPYRQLRYSGTPQPSMATFDPGEVVVSTGSFSKILAPGLRLGFIRTTPSVRGALVVAKQAADLHTSTLDQAAAAAYLAAGRLAPALDRACRAYRERRDALLAALPSALPPGSTWNHPDGGMFVWVELPEGHDTAALLPQALERDVAYVPGAPFYPVTESGPAVPTTTMRLSFTTYPPDVITAGVARLGEVFATAGSGR